MTLFFYLLFSLIVLEFLTIGLFCIGLLACILTKTSIIFALLFGFGVFVGYGLVKQYALVYLLKSALNSTRKVLMIALVMLLIGALTASWRAAGTIAYIVSFACQYIEPEVGLLSAFLLNGLLSTLTGTSFGTVATMGVITMTLLNAMGYPAWLSGGAILAGIYVGDRCSPVSTSALLVCAVTQTAIYKNIRLMIRTSIIPMILSCSFYFIAGFFIDSQATTLDISQIFSEGFNLNLWTVIPALILVACISFRCDIRLTMILSLLSAIPICVWVQDINSQELIRTLLSGYEAKNDQIALLLNGGGVLSMVTVVAIVVISSTFSGLFESTGLICGIQKYITLIAKKITPFGAVIVTSLVTAGIACNQALPIMLTQQLCQPIVPDRQRLAISLENSAVVLAPLVPWCIAGAIPLAILGAPTQSIGTAVYLWLLPLWGLLAQKHRSKQNWNI